MRCPSLISVPPVRISAVPLPAKISFTTLYFPSPREMLRSTAAEGRMYSPLSPTDHTAAGGVTVKLTLPAVSAPPHMAKI